MGPFSLIGTICGLALISFVHQKWIHAAGLVAWIIFMVVTFIRNEWMWRCNVLLWCGVAGIVQIADWKPRQRAVIAATGLIAMLGLQALGSVVEAHQQSDPHG